MTKIWYTKSIDNEKTIKKAEVKCMSISAVTFSGDKEVIKLFDDLSPDRMNRSEVLRKLSVIYVTNPEIREMVNKEHRQTFTDIDPNDLK